MKKLTFNCDGSTAPDNINTIIQYMKGKFPSIEANVKRLSPFYYRCDIDCKNENSEECLKYLKGFASQATYLA